MRKLYVKDKQILEGSVLQYFDRVFRPVLAGEISIYVGRSLDEVETVMNGMVQSRILRRLSKAENDLWGWCDGAISYERLR